MPALRGLADGRQCETFELVGVPARGLFRMSALPPRETAIVSASGALTPIRRLDVPPRDVSKAWAQAQRPRGRT